MPGIFERFMHLVFGSLPEDKISQILKRAALRAQRSRERDFEQTGVLVLPHGDEELRVYSPEATAETVCAAVDSLNWESGINFVVAVPRPGIALELSGSAAPDDGFSFTYLNTLEGIESVSEDPPASLTDAKCVLSAFLRGENSWLARFEGLGNRIAKAT